MCLVECSPALNGPGTKCDASLFPLIVDLKCVMDFGFIFFLSFEFRISAKALWRHAGQHGLARISDVTSHTSRGKK